MPPAESSARSSSPRLLIVDDEEAQMRALCNTLSAEGYLTKGVTSPQAALDTLQTEPFELMLTDLMMPGIDGIALLAAAKRIDPDLVGIVMTGHGTIDTAVKAMQAGALDYIQKPFRLKVILPVLQRGLEIRRLRAENSELRQAQATITRLNEELEQRVRDRTRELEPGESGAGGSESGPRVVLVLRLARSARAAAFSARLLPDFSRGAR